MKRIIQNLGLVSAVVVVATIGAATEAKADVVKLMSKASCSPLSLAGGDVGHSAIAFYGHVAEGSAN
jgi:hypothetical protein